MDFREELTQPCEHCKNLTETIQDCTTPIGVSQWRELGKKYGYWQFFEQEWKNELRGKVEEKKPKDNSEPFGLMGDDANYGYKQAINDILKIIE